MSHIQKVTTKAGKRRYQARYVEPATNRDLSRNFVRKIDAQRYLDGVTTSVVTSTYIAPERGRTTVGELAPLYLASKPRWSPTTAARNANIVEVHISPRWGRVRLEDVDVLGVQGWVGQLLVGGQAPGSVQKIVSVLSGILTLAIKDKRLMVNVTREVDVPRASGKRRRYLDVDQVHQLAGKGRLPVYVLALCGLRWSELSGMRVSCFDAFRRRLSVEVVAVEVNGGRIVEKDPKNYERRSVPVPAFLAEEIAAACRGRGRGELLFPAPSGSWLRNRNARKAWIDEAAAAIGEAGLTPHELRHTAASIAVSAGANVLAVSRMLGHAKPSITLDVYSDLFDSDLDAVASRIDELARAGRAQTDSSRIPDKITDLDARRQVPTGQ